MNHWEDIVKDKLEGYESPLPEGSLAEFRVLRDSKTTRPYKKIVPWILGITAAAAAAILAAVLFLRQPASPEGGVQLIHPPKPLVATIADSTSVTDPFQSAWSFAQAVTSKASAEDVEAITPEEDGKMPEITNVTTPESTKEETIDRPPVTATAPFIPANTDSNPMRIKVGAAAGVVAGGGLLTALMANVFTTNQGNPEPIDPYGTGIGIGIDPLPTDEGIVAAHYFPLKLGLSTRIPLAGQLYLTTGLEYSRYQSSFTYRSTEEKRQVAHYLGIPLRLDWLIASGRFFDVYAGCGLLGDICMEASLAGISIPKDGPSLSLLGTGGIQMNVTKKLGLYVEPELSWRISSEKNKLETYRSEHPFMFSLAAGLRINLGQ